MRKFLLVPLLTVATSLMAEPTEESVDYRFGKITVKSTDGFGSVFTLLINDRKIFDYEGSSITLGSVLSVGERDYILVTKDSGGIACPAEEMYFIELSKQSEPKLSDAFGECSSGGESKIVNGVPTAIVPIYYPNPEYVSPKDLREAEEYEDVYSYIKNKIESSRVKIQKVEPNKSSHSAN
jgi:hypothetical protein